MQKRTINGAIWEDVKSRLIDKDVADRTFQDLSKQTAYLEGDREAPYERRCPITIECCTTELVSNRVRTR